MSRGLGDVYKRQAFGISESIREYEAENEEELTAWIKDGADKKAQLIAE
jgi:hypothetical protein